MSQASINWKTITWQQFQDICCRLLCRAYHYEVMPQSTSGPDGGIDAFIFEQRDAKERIVVQCKHWTTHLTLSKFKTQVKHELSKMNKRNLTFNCYLLMTCYALSKDMKKWFEENANCYPFGVHYLDGPTIDLWLAENQDLRREFFGLPLLRHNWEGLCDACKKNVSTRLEALRKNEKYLPELYVARGIEEEIQEFIDCDDSERNVFVFLGKAGVGKTNVLCHIAAKLTTLRPTDCRPCLLLLGGSLALNDERGLTKRILEELGYDSSLPLEIAGTDLARLLEDQGKSLVILVDAINECSNIDAMRKSLVHLAEFSSRKRIKLCISCRDIFWDFFSNCFNSSSIYRPHGQDSTVSSLSMSQETTTGSGREDPASEEYLPSASLDDFSDSEYSPALQKYLERFAIRGCLAGEASERCRHPLLLRFFCEAFRGQDIGVKDTIRLLDVFDRYWQKKLENIRTVMGLRTDNRLSVFLTKLSQLFRKAMASSMPRSALVKALGIDIDSPDSTYVRVLSEHIILEEGSEKPLGVRVVRFVYDEFFEYVMAKALWEELASAAIDEQQLQAELQLLGSKAEDFPHFAGLIQYFLLMLEKHNRRLLAKTLERLSKSPHFLSPAWFTTIYGLANGMSNLDWATTQILAAWSANLILIEDRKKEGTYPWTSEEQRLEQLADFLPATKPYIGAVLKGRATGFNLDSIESILPAMAELLRSKQYLLRRLALNELLLFANVQPATADAIVERLATEGRSRTQGIYMREAVSAIHLAQSMVMPSDQAIPGCVSFKPFVEELARSGQLNYMIYYTQGLTALLNLSGEGAYEQAMTRLVHSVRLIYIIRGQLGAVLGTLGRAGREAQVLELRFGLGHSTSMSLQEIGNARRFNVSGERIRQLEAMALRKLRHPTRSRRLRQSLMVLSGMPFVTPEIALLRVMFGEKFPNYVYGGCQSRGES